MTDKTDLIREIHEYVTTHGGENTATHLLVQAASAIQTQAAEPEAIGAGGVSGPLMGRASLSANAGEPRALNPRHIRKFLQALQAGEMSVSRAVEILDAWVGGYYEDEMVPLPPPDSCLIADDEFPMEIVRKLRSELAAAPPTAQAEGWRPPELEWDEVFDCAVAAYCRSSTSHDALRLCFQSRNQQHQISCGWTANELMDFARGIARLYSPPTSAEGVEHG